MLTDLLRLGTRASASTYALNLLDRSIKDLPAPPIQFVAGRRAYRDSAHRRVNYNFLHGWQLLHDAPLAPIARLYAVALRTAVHAVWLRLSR
jgi:hypothetical protein